MASATTIYDSVVNSAAYKTLASYATSAKDFVAPYATRVMEFVKPYFEAGLGHAKNLPTYASNAFASGKELVMNSSPTVKAVAGVVALAALIAKFGFSFGSSAK